MMESGMIEEVKFIKDKNYDIKHIDYIGFSEISSYLDKEISREDTIERIHIRTRQYAKRQVTWSRGHMSDWNKQYSNSFNSLSKKILEAIS